VLGSRHFFNSIADTPEDLISLEHLNRMIAIDRERGTVTVEGGITYGQLCRQLHDQGYALHNLASLPHISVAGACATATHGSGDGNGNLATAVAALRLVTADGEQVEISRERDGEQFQGAVVGLGGLGVVTQLTLDVVPAFEVRQDVYLNLPVAQLEAHFEEIVGSAYSVSLFTDWQNERVNQVWVKRRSAGGDSGETAPALFEATPAPRQIHPIASLPPSHAPRSWACPARGTIDCRTSVSTNCRAAARSCKPSTSCRASTPSRPCAWSRPYTSRSPRC
jgi:xylitol oxidase